MASIKNLKKDINNVYGEIIEAVYIWELTNPEKDTKKSQKIIDEAIAGFDNLIEKVNQKTDNQKKHLKTVNEELETEANKLIEKLNKL